MTDGAKGNDGYVAERPLAEWVEHVGRSRWPHLTVVRETLAAYLDARAHHWPDAPSEARASELFLACACLTGRRGAARVFDEVFISGIDAVLLRRRAPADLVDEVKQSLREQLFVGARDRGPTLALYVGRGPLLAWLRVAAVRRLQRLETRSDRRCETRPELIDAIPAGPGWDPETDLLKQRYRSEFRQSLERCLSELCPRDRTLLHLADGLEPQQIADLYDVHRTTAVRWLRRLHYQILCRTRRDTMNRLALTRAEVSSLLRLVASDLSLPAQFLQRPESNFGASARADSSVGAGSVPA